MPNNNQAHKDFLESIRASQVVYEKIKSTSRKISTEELTNQEYIEATRKADERIDKEKIETAKKIFDARNERYR